MNISVYIYIFIYTYTWYTGWGRKISARGLIPCEKNFFFSRFFFLYKELPLLNIIRPHFRTNPLCPNEWSRIVYIARVAISIIKVKNAIMETANLSPPYNKKKSISMIESPKWNWKKGKRLISLSLIFLFITKLCKFLDLASKTLCIFPFLFLDPILE